MTKKIDLELVDFELKTTFRSKALEPDDALAKNTLTIKGHIDGDDDFCAESETLAKIEFYALHNYDSSEISLFDCFDAHSQYLCNVFEYVNSSDNHSGVVEQQFSTENTIILISRIDVEEGIIDAEKDTVQLFVEFLNRQYGSDVFCFGIACEMMNYTEEQATNEKEIMEALSSNGFEINLTSSTMEDLDDAKPVFRQAYN